MLVLILKSTDKIVLTIFKFKLEFSNNSSWTSSLFLYFLLKYHLPHQNRPPLHFLQIIKCYYYQFIQEVLLEVDISTPSFLTTIHYELINGK